jgi:hypothetical protein
VTISDDDRQRCRVLVGQGRLLVVMGSGLGFADPE